MNNAKHSPKPWKDDGRCKTIGWMPSAYITDAEDMPIANVRSPEDAATIIKAVNCHEELVEALKLALDGLENNRGPVITHQKILRIEKALAKAGA